MLKLFATVIDPSKLECFSIRTVIKNKSKVLEACLVFEVVAARYLFLIKIELLSIFFIF